MTFETRIRQAVSPAGSLLRSRGITLLAVFYGVTGIVCLLFACLGSYRPSGHHLGPVLLPPEVARLFLALFGAGLLYVGWGFLRLKSSAWTLFMTATWAGVGIHLLWLLSGLAAGGPSLRYLVHLAVDGGLLAYVYSQRRIFIH